MAYDPLLHGGELVYFGGENARGAPTNITWAYSGGTWTNVSSQLGSAPPPRFGASLEFAPVYAGLVLFGGIVAKGSLAADSWLLFADHWLNLSTVNSAVGSGPSVAFAAAAWDPALGGVLAVGGCAVANCSRATTSAWLLNGSGWRTAGALLGVPATYAAAMAFDTADSAMLLFGGMDPGRGTPSNATFELLGLTWVNLTSSSATCATRCAYPRAGEHAGLTWSGRSGTLLLFGGDNPTNGSATNGSWSFLHGKWTALLGASAPPTTTDSEMASDSSAVAPVLLESGCALACPLASWSWDTPPAPHFTVFTPNPSDVGATVSLELGNYPVTGSGPTMSWAVNYGDLATTSGSLQGLNFTSAWSVVVPHRWSSRGTFSVVATVSDFCHVSGTTTVTALVAPRLMLEVRANVTSVGPGAPVGLAGLLAGGISPAKVSWSFGDGAVGSGGNVTHTYAAPGIYTVNASATDGGGGSAVGSVRISVIRPLSVALVANWSRVDAGVPVGFVGNAAGGSGNYTSFTWSFGDGANATGATPVHSYTAPGSYRVLLSVADSAGGNGSGALPLTVEPPLVAVPTASPSTGPAGLSFEFGDNRTGGTGPFSYAWQFGDGSSSGAEYPIHSFGKSGSYTVRLWVNDSGGGSVEGMLTVRVGGPAHPAAIAPILVLVVAAGALATALGVIVMRRRARKVRGEPPQPDPRSAALADD
ncbi:MAG: PKD domain-containing protein [Thermoplasmata archaeon]|nr:PKD domain-containing protein [Thermoplasmata archaeon]